MLRFDRKQNSVKQLSFNLKINFLKGKKIGEVNSNSTVPKGGTQSLHSQVPSDILPHLQGFFFTRSKHIEFFAIKLVKHNCRGGFTVNLMNLKLQGFLTCTRYFLSSKY